VFRSVYSYRQGVCLDSSARNSCWKCLPASQHHFANQNIFAVATPKTVSAARASSITGVWPLTSEDWRKRSNSECRLSGEARWQMTELLARNAIAIIPCHPVALPPCRYVPLYTQLQRTNLTYAFRNSYNRAALQWQSPVVHHYNGLTYFTLLLLLQSINQSVYLSSHKQQIRL